MSTRSLQLRDLLDQLATGDEITPGQPASAPRTLPPELSGRDDAESSPWYVKALAGIGAWFAAFFLGLFLAMAGLIDSWESMMIWGAILAVAAIWLKHWLYNSIFWGQLAFAFSLAGQGLLIAGLIGAVESITISALFAAGIATLMFLLYPDSMHRLLTLLLFVVAWVVIIEERTQPDLFHLMALALGIATVAVWQGELRLIASRWHPFRAPLAYGLPLALFGLCLLPLIDFFGIHQGWWSASGLALLLLYVAYQILRDLGWSLLSPVGLWAVAAVLLLLVPAYSTPGILAAVIMLLLGYWRGSSLMMGLATLFLLFFLSAYYYNLDVTLLNKSYILMGTGGVLLALRFGLQRVLGRIG